MAGAEPISLPPPRIDPPMTAPGKWAREYQAFRRLLPELLRTHRDQYVAVHEGQVIATGTDKLEVAMEAFRQIGNVSIHVGLVSEAPEAVLRSGVRRALPPGGGVG